MVNVTDFPAPIFPLSDTEHVNWSIQCLANHLRAGAFHLDHSCKSESAFLQEEELTRLHYTAPEKTHTHPTAWASFPMGKVKVH